MARNESPEACGRLASLPVIVNFADDATQWFRDIASAVCLHPVEIRVQFVGGSTAPPFELISLRNALLEIPEEIRLVTVAGGSLAPFCCAPWLVGDERRIARDALVWIPKLPEELLRNGSRGMGAPGQPSLAGGGDEAEEVEEGQVDPSEMVHASRVSSRLNQEVTLGWARMDADLRALADVLNEWFPTWEFSGSCLKFEDLVSWGIVRPEWGFAGPARRTRTAESVRRRSAQLEAVDPEPTSVESVANPDAAQNGSYNHTGRQTGGATG